MAPQFDVNRASQINPNGYDATFYSNGWEIKETTSKKLN